jgi:hypothetical protein
MISSGIVMNWAVWGAFAGVGSFYFLMIVGHRRDSRDKKTRK